jgi:hypothetical protein
MPAGSTTRVKLTVLGAFALAAITAANVALLASVGWGGGCDEPTLAGPETLTSVYCRHYHGFYGPPSLQELGTGLGPSMLLLGGAAVAIGLRRPRALLIAGAIATAWALWGWLPPLVDLLTR